MRESGIEGMRDMSDQRLPWGGLLRTVFVFFLIGIREGQFRQKKRLDREVDTGSRGLCV